MKGRSLTFAILSPLTLCKEACKLPFTALLCLPHTPGVGSPSPQVAGDFGGYPLPQCPCSESWLAVKVPMTYWGPFDPLPSLSTPPDLLIYPAALERVPGP
jgi:hypothetical protein